MTLKQKMKLGNLCAAHRVYNECADYLESPTMIPIINYVESLLKSKQRIINKYIQYAGNLK